MIALLLTLTSLAWSDAYFQEPQFVPAPTFASIPYGAHERQVLDFWQAKGKGPRPLLLWIHGGGFNKGSKSVKKVLLETCLSSGISVAAINYRYASQANGLAPFLDGARSVQFLRTKAREWNLAPSKFVCAGNSAGAGISLWIGFHDDLADSTAQDPVLRQSTRISLVGAFEAQTTYDPRTLKEKFPSQIYKIGFLEILFGMKLDHPDKATPEQQALFEECSPINFVSRDDPPVYMVYSWPDEPLEKSAANESIQIHHPYFGTLLQEKLASFGIACSIVTGVRPYILDKTPPPLNSEERFHQTLRDFAAKIP